MRKENKGITLVALVITIIVLIILAMVSLNAIVGDNGILSQAMESRILTYLSDIMFNIESEIIDINISRMPNEKKLTSTEMIDELKRRKLLNNETKELFGSMESTVVQTGVNTSRLEGLTIGYNGDLWLNNYKRGKIQLSSQISKYVSEDGEKDITIIDGTWSPINVDGEPYNDAILLCSLKDRDDFACWVNEYGEIVSQYSDAIIFDLLPGKREYTAIYDKELQQEILGLDNKLFMGLETNYDIDSAGNYMFSTFVSHCYYSHFYLNKNDFDHKGLYIQQSQLHENKPVTHTGCRIVALAVIMSDKYEDLVADEHGIKKQGLGTLSFNTLGYKPSINNNPFYYYRDDTTSEKYSPLIGNDEYLYLTGQVNSCKLNLTKEIEKYKEQGITRIYYRGAAQVIVQNIKRAEKFETGGWFTWEGGLFTSYFESTIKYIDI